jgi:hypothetical protein
MKKFNVGDKVVCKSTYTDFPEVAQGKVFTISGYRKGKYPRLKEMAYTKDCNYWDEECFELVNDKSKEVDLINLPPHYTVGGIDTLDYIEAKGLNMRLGNAIKYISRCDHKGSKISDLKKAIFYIQREIDKSEDKE